MYEAQTFLYRTIYLIFKFHISSLYANGAIKNVKSQDSIRMSAAAVTPLPSNIEELRKLVTARFEASHTPRIATSRIAGDAKGVLLNPSIQKWCLRVLSVIEHHIYSHEFRISKLTPLLTKESAKYLESETTTRENLYKFVLKGGNAVALTLQKSKTLPFNVDSDFDSDILINPVLPTSDFNNIRDTLLETATSLIYNIDREAWPTLTSIVGSAGFTFYPSSYTYSDPAGSKYVVMDDAPFYIKTNSDLGYFDKSTKLVIVLHTSLIKVLAKTYDKLELLDVAIPHQTNPKLANEWLVESPILFEIPSESIKVSISNPLSLYIDQRVSAAANERPNKKLRRTQRANRIRNSIIIPEKSAYIRNIGHFMKTPLRNIISNLYNKSLENSVIAAETRKAARREKEKVKAASKAAASASAKKAAKNEEALLAEAIAAANKERAERREKHAEAARKRVERSAAFHKENAAHYGTPLGAVEFNASPSTSIESGIKKMFENAGIPIMKVARVDTSLKNDLKSMVSSLVKYSTERHKANPSPETSAEQARVLALAAYIYERPQEEINAAILYAAMTEEDPEGVVAAALIERSRLQEMDAPIPLLTFAEATVSVAVMILEMKETLKKAKKV